MKKHDTESTIIPLCFFFGVLKTSSVKGSPETNGACSSYSIYPATYQVYGLRNPQKKDQNTGYLGIKPKEAFQHYILRCSLNFYTMLVQRWGKGSTIF